MKARSKSGRQRVLNHEREASLIRLYFNKPRKKQVWLAIQFRISQASVSRYISRAL